MDSSRTNISNTDTKRQKTKQFGYSNELKKPASAISLVKIGQSMFFAWTTWGTLSQTLTLKLEKLVSLYFSNYLQDHHFRLKSIRIDAQTIINYMVCKSWPMNSNWLITSLTGRITTYYTTILMCKAMTVHGTFLFVEVTCDEINTVPRVDLAPPNPIIWWALSNRITHSFSITNGKVSSERWFVRHLTSSSLCINIQSKIWCQKK